MTESEAIKELKEDIALYDNEITRLDASVGTPDRNLIDALEMAIQALEEVQRYREIGTAEECQLATEKYTPKKVILFDYYNGTVNYGCPVCKTKIISKVCGEWCAGKLNEYCDRCGQKLDWSDENEIS